MPEPGNTARLPSRRRPAHFPLLELPNRSCITLLTICTNKRRPLLARPEIHDLLREVWSGSNAWLVGRYALMPDHLHLFCAPSEPDAVPLGNWIRFWKSFSSKRWPYASEKPVWQSNHWDRQLRKSEHYSRKWDYVKNNPVRAGLCQYPDAWPFQGELTQFRFHDA